MKKYILYKFNYFKGSDNPHVEIIAEDITWRQLVILTENRPAHLSRIGEGDYSYYKPVEMDTIRMLHQRWSVEDIRANAPRPIYAQ